MNRALGIILKNDEYTAILNDYFLFVLMTCHLTSSGDWAGGGGGPAEGSTGGFETRKTVNGENWILWCSEKD